jgi:hypothetical protein
MIMFLNFFLDPNPRKFAGVDLTKFFPEHGAPVEVWWVTWARISMGLRPWPFIAVQIMAWLEEVIFRDRKDKGIVSSLGTLFTSIFRGGLTMIHLYIGPAS